MCMFAFILARIGRLFSPTGQLILSLRKWSGVAELSVYASQLTWRPSEESRAELSLGCQRTLFHGSKGMFSCPCARTFCEVVEETVPRSLAAPWLDNLKQSWDPKLRAKIERMGQQPLGIHPCDSYMEMQEHSTWQNNWANGIYLYTLSPNLEIWFLVSPKHSLEDNFVRGTVPQTVSAFPLGIFFFNCVR